jgi:hypothetical protein
MNDGWAAVFQYLFPWILEVTVPRVGPMIAVEYPYVRAPRDITITKRTLFQLN